MKYGSIRIPVRTLREDEGCFNDNIAFAAHLYLKNLILPLLIILPNIFWCLLYYRYRSLLGVTVSHL